MEERDNIHKQIKDLEHIGDEITNKTYEQLNKSFITPFDREDIHELTGHIDDVVDEMNNISRRICLYKPKGFRPVFSKMAELVFIGAKELAICFDNLEHATSKRRIILESCQKIKDIEHQADELYFEGIQDIFENELDPKAIIIYSKILENLERCVDEEEDITDTIRTILIKMA
jgi:predicted phosphate transport protein (TIGR00153 family)